MNRLATDVSRTTQTVEITELWETNGGQRIRLRMRSGHERDYCMAKADRWDGGQWHDVWSLGSGVTRMPIKLHVGRKTDDELVQAFDIDRMLLIQRVGQVLDISTK